MSYEAEVVARQEVGKLLRERGEVLCSSCLTSGLRLLFVSRFTKGQIERAVAAVFKSPGALNRRHSFICDQCGKPAPCLGA